MYPVIWCLKFNRENKRERALKIILPMTTINFAIKLCIHIYFELFALDHPLLCNNTGDLNDRYKTENIRTSSLKILPTNCNNIIKHSSLF